jgi:signal transduction histidine kinase/CheY-like chemotaxis protein/HPt (histidine-containing phosphotransfer) domain-containing protein
MQGARWLALLGCGVGLAAGLAALALPAHAMLLALMAAIGAGLGFAGILLSPRGADAAASATAASTPIMERAEPAEEGNLRAELERHRVLEQELIRARQEAEAATMAKGEFLATMSHEIRTPLNGVIPLLDLVLSTELSPDQRDYLTTAYSSSRELLRIVDDILDYSKLDAQKLRLENVGVNLKELAISVLRLMEKSAEAKGLRLGLAIDPKVRLAVRGDPVRLRQVLTNLVSNAIKFTDRGRVSVHITQPGATRTRNKLRFEVRDTGIGITREAAAHLFQPFSQADASTTRTFGGTGLGLAICKRIVTLMDGTIGVNSTPGKGATFWFEVALDKAPGDIEGGAASDAAGTRVLMVTASASQQRRLGALLQQWGVGFVHAGNTQEALARLRATLPPGQRGFSLVLVDATSIPNTVRALHRTLARETRPDQTVRVYLRGEEALPGELGATPGFHVLMRDSDDRDLRLRLAALLDAAAEEVVERAPPDPLSDVSDDLAVDRQDEPKVIEVARLESPSDLLQAAPAMPVVERREPDAAAAVDTPEPVSVAPVAPQRAAAAMPGGRVLLVEDNPVNRQVAQRLLSLAGIAFDSAENGKEALDKMNAGSYVSVLMDCQMPIMDGYTATRQRRQHEKAHRLARLPIIAMTANAMLGDREKCLEAGMDDYLSKPLNRALLETTLRSWMATQAGSAEPQAAAPLASAGPAASVPKLASTVRSLPPAAVRTRLAAAPPVSTEPPIDTEILDELRDIMGTEFVSLVRVFLDDAPAVIQRIQTHAAEGNSPALAGLAHTLKSTSANLGARVLSGLARSMEQDARQGMVMDAQRRADAMEAEFERVAAVLRKGLA